MREDSEEKASDYDISSADANELKGAVLLPLEFRLMVLRKYKAERGCDALINLFANFIGMANAVVANTRDAAELLLIIQGDMHPNTAEKINTPSLFGALQGAELANKVDQKKTCVGCAFRKGSLANQSPSTTADVHWCLGGDDQFMCHEHMDDEGNPTVPCGGHAQILRKG